uniref:Ig-like domain-containing protein n=1 Tax=Poecilia formosa TaxID=48698 RepID=A0A096MHW5_POEFO
MLNIFHSIFFSPGSESVKTINKVSVKAGASVSIPCSYDGKYKNHVKYLCKGYVWSSCTYEIRTDSQRETGKYSISEDKSQRIFTVTIKQLTADDTYYWCAVENNNEADIGQRFLLSVTTGTPILSVADQNVIGYIGEKITINCSYRDSGGVSWCKLGSTCVTVSGNIDAATINTAVSNVISVTMSGLKSESSGWYYCVKRDFQMPVHLTVTVKPSGNQCITTYIDWSNIPTETRKENSSVTPLMILAIPLSVLIFIVIVALSILFVLRGTKRVKNKDSTASKFCCSCQETECEKETTCKRITFLKKPDQSEGKDEDVTYSTIIRHKQ